eukprot:TRINITY_DN11064_c0_g1_i1.p1 TRINITY_DN11064_c0_g1~~TRINITY_DN11064_c0_g1_i1.p1  ORF type:complete len:486 (+),score=103.10 TRINITY_DN11064_c0_g1_i1:105-1562(+)
MQKLLHPFLGDADAEGAPNVPEWQTMEPPFEWLRKLRASNAALPRWAYHDGVAAVLQQLEDRSRRGESVPKVPPLTCTCGPAIKFGWLNLLNVWSYFLIAPCIAYFLCECPSDNGFATLDDTPLMAVLGIVFLFAAWCQYKCVSVVIVSQLDVTKEFEFNGFPFNSMHYGVWLLTMTGLMGLNLLDIFTNAEVLGRAVYTATCPSYNEISDVWHNVMHDSSSLVRMIPGWESFDFSDIALVFYALMLLQPMFALVASVPTECGVTYQAGFGKEFKFQYRTLYDRVANHGGVLMMLSEGSRMEAVVFQDAKYTLMKMDIWKDSHKHAWQKNYLHLVTVALGRGVSRFFLKGVLQTALQISLQISLAAIFREATGKIDKQMMFSVVVTMCGMVTDLPDAVDIIQIGWRVLSTLPRSKIMEIEDEDVRRQCMKERSKILARLVRFAFYMMIYVGCVLWAIGKLYGYFFCPSHLWNVGKGCAHDTTGFR